MKEYMPEYYKNNKAKFYTYTENRRARKAALINDLTQEQWFGLLADFDGVCAYCQENKATEMDHFYPLSKGGGTTVSNIVPACKPCNKSKYNHDPLEWLGIQT